MLQNNPLDNVEDILSDNNWVYTRTGQDQLRLDVRGDACEYNIVFVWQDAINALQLVCEYDLEIHAQNISNAYKALNDMNARLLIGHFELRDGSYRPSFRHSCLMQRGDVQSIEDFVEISLMQCEQNQPAFQMLAAENSVGGDALSLALMDTQGES